MLKIIFTEALNQGLQGRSDPDVLDHSSTEGELSITESLHMGPSKCFHILISLDAEIRFKAEDLEDIQYKASRIFFKGGSTES